MAMAVRLAVVVWEGGFRERMNRVKGLQQIAA